MLDITNEAVILLLLKNAKIEFYIFLKISIEIVFKSVNIKKVITNFIYFVFILMFYLKTFLLLVQNKDFYI